MKRDAKISDCNLYRYTLWRIWDPAKPIVMFICLNPSTADAEIDDPTIKRCVSFAKVWGYGGLCMGNLFAYRSTSPTDIYSTDDPIGPDNDYWLRELSKDAELTVAAWGNHGNYLGRAEHIRRLFPALSYIKMNRTGEPSHPLYLRSNCQPTLWYKS